VLSQEVRDNISLLRVDGLGHLGEELEVSVEVVVDRQHARHVAAAVAVVGRGPHRDEVAQGEVVLVALHH